MVITLPSLPGPAVGLRCAFAIRGFIERSAFRGVEGAQGADLVTGARFCDCHSHSLGRLRKTRLRDKSLPQRLKAVTDSERLSRP